MKDKLLVSSKEPEMCSLDAALQIAIYAHTGQLDKQGEPYILHVIRVMMACSNNRDAMIVAALHDVLEDSPIEIDDLVSENFPHAIVEAVDFLTRKDGQDYQSYIIGLSENQLARIVKIADLKDNMSNKRLEEASKNKVLTREFIATYKSLHNRYVKALRFLESLPLTDW